MHPINGPRNACAAVCEELPGLWSGFRDLVVGATHDTPRYRLLVRLRVRARRVAWAAGPPA